MDIYETGPMIFFTVGNFIQDFGTLYQIYHSEYIKRNTECVSLDTQVLFFISTITRIFWMNDSLISKYTITYIELLFSFIIHLYFVVYVILSRPEPSTKQLFDLGQRFWEKWYLIAIITFVLGFLFHPKSYYHYRNYWRDIQMCVAFNIYTDAGSLIPQLPVLWREGDVGSVSRLYITFLFGARCFRLLFWMTWYWGSRYIYLMCVDILYLVCVGAFVLSFCKDVNKMLLPMKNQ